MKLRPFHQKFAKLAAAALCALATVSPGAQAAGTGGLRLETLKTHSRLVLDVEESLATRWKNTGKGFEILLPGLTLADLGAPLGTEAAWKRDVAALGDARLSGLDVTEDSEGVRVKGRWNFPTGKAQLADPRMEAFDFREKGKNGGSARFVVDFWMKAGETLANVQLQRRAADRRAAEAKAEAEAKARADRRAAQIKRRGETEDLHRFCRMPLTEQTDVFLPLLPVHEKARFSRWLPTTLPDDRFRYFEPTKAMAKAKDAQYVRLALSLNQQGNPALVARTLDFLDKEHSRSQYRTEMKLLRASAFVKLGMIEQADPILRKLMTESKDAPVGVQAGMYLAGRDFEKGMYLAALESFSWLSSHAPRHKLAWIFHFGAAESMYALRQTERAASEYQWVVDKSPDRASRAQAGLRMGDIFLDRLQYDQALAAYYGSLKSFAEEAASFPAIHVNRAEALYGLGQYDRAREGFEKFLAQFGAHPAGWRAAFRLGEIHARKPGEAAAAESRKWFAETINRFPTSAGATLARLRLLPCGDHGGFTAETAERFLAGEASELEASGELVASRYPGMLALARVRAMVSLASNSEAIDSAVDELHATLDPEVRRIIGDTLTTLFRREILAMLEKGKKFEALHFYQEKAGTVPVSTAIVDPDYLLALSQAASDLGLGQLGQQLADIYRKSAAIRAAAMAEADAAEAGGGTAPASRREVASGHGGSKKATSAGDPTDPEAQAASSEQAFTEAKALWIGASRGGAKAKLSAESASETTRRIRELLGKVREESPNSWQRELILSLVDEREQQLNSALTHGVKAQMLLPEEAERPADLRMEYRLAALQEAAGDLQVALRMYRAVELSAVDAAEESLTPGGQGEAKRAPSHEEVFNGHAAVSGALGVPPIPSIEAIRIAQGRIFEKQLRWGDAAAAYLRASEPATRPAANQASYAYARALIKAGGKDNRRKSRAALEKLAGSKTNDFWKKLATEALEDEKRLEAMPAPPGEKFSL